MSKIYKTAELKERLESLYAFLDASIDFMADYPAWEYSEKSPLRDIACEAYKNVAGKDIIVIGIHAGLECGIMISKIPGLDCVSFGPELKDIHTTSERMDIASVQRTWDYLLEILKRLK